MPQKKRAHKTSNGERKSSRKIPLSNLDRILMGKGVFQSLKPSGMYSGDKKGARK